MTTEQNKSPPQHTADPLWIDDDGFIAAGTGDSYQTIADTRSSPNAVADADFIVRACNSHYKLLEALEDVIIAVQPDINLTNGQCRHCGRDYMEEAHELAGLCPSDDCPGFKARDAIAKARRQP